MSSPTALRFNIRVGRREFDRKQYPPGQQLGPASIGHVFFTHPVAFSVGGAELLGSSDNPFENLPLLHVAVHMRQALDLSAVQAIGKFEPLPATTPLIFRTLPGGDVEVAGEMGTGLASREEIERAMDEFDTSVREFLLEDFPDLVANAQYGWWFRREPPPQVAETS